MLYDSDRSAHIRRTYDQQPRLLVVRAEVEGAMHTPTVLVVEADLSIRMLLNDILCGEGYHVQLQDQGMPSVSAVVAARPDLLLLEIQSSNAARSLAWIEEVRRLPATAGQPILVTATDPLLLARYSAAFRRLGCVTLLKPFELDSFLEMISQRVATAA